MKYPERWTLEFTVILIISVLIIDRMKTLVEGSAVWFFDLFGIPLEGLVGDVLMIIILILLGYFILLVIKTIEKKWRIDL